MGWFTIVDLSQVSGTELFFALLIYHAYGNYAFTSGLPRQNKKQTGPIQISISSPSIAGRTPDRIFATSSAMASILASSYEGS